MSLLEAWAAFLEERSISLSPSSLVTDYAQVTKWLKRCPVQDLEQGRQVVIWVLGQKPVKSSRRVCMFVRSMYRWAASEDVGILTKNPVANFHMPKAPQQDHEVRVITKPELTLIMIALASKAHHCGTDWSLFAEFMLQTGMRTGEVRALKWTDLDEDNSRALVHCNYTLTHGHKDSTKTNKKRWVPLNGTVLQILAGLPRNSDYIFPWNRYSFQSFFRDKVDQLHQAGLVKARYRPYDLRHVAISRWLEAGIPVAQAAKWAGNTNEVIFKHYCNATREYQIPDL
jgi:integrase